MKYASIILCLILLSSCEIGRHLPEHGAMRKEGEKAHKASQGGLASRFGGGNFHRPNRFRRRHFKSGYIAR